MKASRSVDIIDDEAEVRDALTLLLSTAQIESRSYGSADLLYVGKPELHRLHFRFDLVQRPSPALRAAVRANPYGFSATQTRQLLQRGAQHRLDF